MTRFNHLLPVLGPRPRVSVGDEAHVPPAQALHPAPPEVRLPWAQAGDAAAAWAKVAARHVARDPAPLAPARDVDVPTHAPTEATVRLAVVLDLLATQTRPLRAGPHILTQLAEALLTLRLSHASPEILPDGDAQHLGEELRALALGPVGEARAALAGPLATCAQALGEIATTPEGVTLACRRLEAAATAAIEHAVWSLAAHEARARAQPP